MSYTKEALDKVLDLHAASLKLPVTDTALVALPNGVDLHSLEPYHQLRARFRGTFHTTSLNHFIEAANERDNACFVDPSDMTAVAIFNMGTVEAPGHCDDKAVLESVKTAPFRALLATNGQRVSQRTAAEWLEEWRDFITVYDETGDHMEIAKACNALRNMTVDRVNRTEVSVGDFAESKGVLDSMEVKASKSALPGMFTFECQPYKDLAPRRFSVRISASIGAQNAIGIVFRVMQLEKLQEEMAQELVEALEAQLKTDLVRIGSFRK